jgi:hypothetical protein
MVAANTYGRQIVVPLTNKSGGGVIAGDVVIVDTTNNDAFTTTTSASSTAIVGIVQETIANNATGRVLIGGYAALVNVNASVTRGNYGITHTVAKQAASGGASRTTGTFCQFLTGGTTPDAMVYNPDLGGASLTNPMTNSQDIIVGGASGVPGRLGAGAAGAALSMINSVIAWNSGTSFPGSKATGDRYWRTDLGLLFYWDGTRWVTVNEYSTSGVTETLAPTATNTLTRMAALTDFDIYATVWDVSTFVVTTNNGTSFWTIEAVKTSTANADTNMTTGNTSADAANTWTRHKLTVNTAIVSAANPTIGLHATKTSAPGQLFYSATLRFRIIGT